MATATGSARRASGARGSLPFDDDDEPFEPLSDEDYDRVMREADEARKTPGQQRREHNAEAKRQADDARADYDEHEHARSARVARARAAGRRVSDAGGSARRAPRTIGAQTLGLVEGRRPASISAAILGVLGYAVIVNYLHGGWPQVKGWLAAKFANVPYAPAATAAAKTPAPSSPAKLAVVRTGTVTPPGRTA